MRAPIKHALAGAIAGAALAAGALTAYEQASGAQQAAPALQVTEPRDVRLAKQLVKEREQARAKLRSKTLRIRALRALNRSPHTATSNRALARAMASSLYGWQGYEWTALERLWSGESGFNHLAANHQGSGAYGIPQALPGHKMASAGADWATNPATQIAWGLRYIKQRYGSPSRAYALWRSRSPHWY